jgi:hypothetical protein
MPDGKGIGPEAVLDLLPISPARRWETPGALGELGAEQFEDNGASMYRRGPHSTRPEPLMARSRPSLRLRRATISGRRVWQRIIGVQAVVHGPDGRLRAVPDRFDGTFTVASVMTNARAITLLEWP